jgi:hypothetical protein
LEVPEVANLLAQAEWIAAASVLIPEFQLAQKKMCHSGKLLCHFDAKPKFKEISASRTKCA